MSNNDTIPSSATTTPTADISTGFVTARISQLPIGIRVILSLLCIVIGLGLCTVSPYAARWGTQWGTAGSANAPDTAAESASYRRDIGESPARSKFSVKFRLAGGVLGIFAGGLGAAYTILLFSFAVLSTQEDPTLSPWALLAISLVSAALGAVLGGRWKAVSRLFLASTGSISLTLLFTTSFKIDRKLGRLIIFAILFVGTFTVSFIFSLFPRTTLQRVSTRLSFFMTTCTGAWLAVAIGMDMFVKIGLLDAPTLLASKLGIFNSGPPGIEEEADVGNVVRWNEARCKGMLAGMWLLIVAGTIFQQWRYSVIGDDPDESWNSYLGSLLSDEKNLMNRMKADSGAVTNGRAGVFTRRQHWFSRLFMSDSRKKKRDACYLYAS